MVLFIGVLLIVIWLVLFPPSLPDVRTVQGRRTEAHSIDGCLSLRGNRGRCVSAHRGIWQMPNLSRRRMWFADDGEGGGAGATDEINLESLDPAVRRYITTLKTQLDETRHESIGRRKYIERIEAENEAMTRAKREQQEAQGKYKDLYELELKTKSELQLKAERAEAYEMQIKAGNEAKIAQIPETYRDVVPDLPPDRLSVWLDTNMAKFTTPIAPELDAGASTGGGSQNAQLTAEEKEVARRFKMTDEEYLKFK